MRKLNGDHCHCATCGKYFNSTAAFDKHRWGSYLPNTRRCLSVAEMEAKGMCLSASGWWVTRAKTDSYPSRVRRNGDRHQVV